VVRLVVTGGSLTRRLKRSLRCLLVEVINEYLKLNKKYLQDLFGRRTISRYLMNRDEMYETSPRSVALDRGMSLHKMIRLITHALAGESYMNFMGRKK